MENRNKIIVVANQKGGVGKSTVCMALANYLAVELKFNVGGIIDTDFQTSITKKRKADLQRIAGSEDCPSYEVTSFSLDNYLKLPDLIEELRKTNMFYIFDTPGRLNHEGIVSLVALADYVIVPYNYVPLNLMSTIEFIIFYNNLKDHLKKEQGYELENRIFFLPNNVDDRMGTAKEREMWEAVKKASLSIGTIVPQINYLKKMQSVNTIRLEKEQIAAVTKAFETIVMEIFTGGKNTENYETDESA